jgi:hypothetical protein
MDGQLHRGEGILGIEFERIGTKFVPEYAKGIASRIQDLSEATHLTVYVLFREDFPECDCIGRTGRDA